MAAPEPRSDGTARGPAPWEPPDRVLERLEVMIRVR